MLVSPFTYYRGAALSMASDLSTTPVSGFTVQLCGDAHLSNFGIFGSPERHLVFDVNDFDETAPGPWEWDLKRLAASLEIAGRDNGLTSKERARIVRRAAKSYRDTIRDFAERSMLEVWYAHLDMDVLMAQFEQLVDPERTPAVWHAIDKARAHDSMQAFAKLCCMLDGQPRIASDPPLVLPVEAVIEGAEGSLIVEAMEDILRTYRKTLSLLRAPPARAVPLCPPRPQGGRRRQRRQRHRGSRCWSTGTSARPSSCR